MKRFSLGEIEIDLETVAEIETEENLTSAGEELHIFPHGDCDPLVFIVNDAAGIRNKMREAMGLPSDD